MFNFKFLFFIFLLLFAVATPVFAVNFGTDIAGEAAISGGYSKTTSETTFAETVGTVIYMVLSLVGAIFLTLMVYAGYIWMTARGEEEEVKKSQKIIIACVIGLIILVGAYSITSFVVPWILSSAAIGATKK